MSLSNEEILITVLKKCHGYRRAYQRDGGWCVSASSGSSSSTSCRADGGEQQAEEKTEFDVVLMQLVKK